MDRAAASDAHLNGASDVDIARFDPDQLGRALDNLIINGLQHTPAGGKISVSASRANEWLRVTVSDTGSGILEKLREHLFEPFASDREGGT